MLMKKPAKFTFDIDAAAITLLEYYKGGDYAYEKGEKKTDKQRNLKRDFKECFDNMVEHPELLKHTFCEALNDLLMACDVTQIETLKEENKNLTKKIERMAQENDNQKACYLAQNQDEWREQWFGNMRNEDAKTIHTLRTNLQKVRAENEELTEKNRMNEHAQHLREENDNLIEINRELNTKLFKLRNKKTKKGKSPKNDELQKKIEEKRKKMEEDKKELELLMSKSNSEDNINEDYITDSEQED